MRHSPSVSPAGTRKGGEALRSAERCRACSGLGVSANESSLPTRLTTLRMDGGWDEGCLAMGCTRAMAVAGVRVPPGSTWGVVWPGSLPLKRCT